MKKLHRCALLFVLGLFFSSYLQAVIVASNSEGQGVTPHLIAAVDSVIPGEPFDVYLLLDLAEGWHVYWQYPGDSGFAPSVKWDLPEDWSATDLEFSLPQQFAEPGGMVIYGYEKQALMRARITPEKHLAKNSTWKIGAKISWLACSDLCIPGSTTLSTTIDATTPRTAEERTMALAFAEPTYWPATTAPPFAVFIAHQEKNYVVSFQAEQGCCYQLFPLPAAGSSAGHVVMTQHGRYYQMTVPWEGDAPFHALLVGNDAMQVRRAWFLPATIAAKPAMPGSFGVLFIALLSGLLGGLILNLMPCVLPVISLKIFGFINQAGSSRSKILKHGLAFVAGIYLWFLALGFLVVFLKASGMQVTWAFQFQNPAFLLTLSILVFLFALNLFGVFEITLHGKAGSSLDQLASRSGYGGSFFQGLFATLLATPCTAPFLGSALGFAFAQSGSVIMAMFFAVATGMSFPYLILSMHPVWMRLLPRPGAWMERVKQLMAFPLLATNLWLLSILGASRGMAEVLMVLLLLLFLGLSVWIYGAYFSSKKSVRNVALLLSLIIAGTSLWYLVPKILAVPAISSSSNTEETKLSSPSNQTIEWIPYSAARLEQLRSEGKAVFVDFTAAWCLTCHFNEQTAINTTAVRALLQKESIVPMKADWTNANPEITQALKAFGRVGVPFYVFYPASHPGQQVEPITFSELLTEGELIKAFSTPGS